ncbi:MAG: PrgI family protein [Candidatus Pacebacteria bacterium]|nr:PrgI family protein [Candidatus Paceibacterota bacterium]
MQFKVPQFLDIEDKIFGPFTFREFVYLAGGAGLCFILYKLLGLILGIIPILAVAGFSLALTFYKPNNKPFINIIESGFKYFTQNKLYIWKKKANKTTSSPAFSKGEGALSFGEGLGGVNKIQMMHPGSSPLSGSKLRDLAWSLDVLDLSKQQSR